MAFLCSAIFSLGVMANRLEFRQFDLEMNVKVMHDMDKIRRLYNSCRLEIACQEQETAAYKLVNGEMHITWLSFRDIVIKIIMTFSLTFTLGQI